MTYRKLDLSVDENFLNNHKKRKVRRFQYKLDKYGRMVRPWKDLFTDIEDDEDIEWVLVEKFEDELDDKNFNMADHLDDYDIVDKDEEELSKKELSMEERKRNVREISQIQKFQRQYLVNNEKHNKDREQYNKNKEILDEIIPLSHLAPGTIITYDSEYREEQPPVDGVHSKPRPLAYSQRTNIKGHEGEVALLQITTSPPRKNFKDGNMYDIRIDHNYEDCGLDDPSTIRCADIAVLPKNEPIYKWQVRGSLDCEETAPTWDKVVEMCDKVPDKAFTFYDKHNKLLNCSMSADSNVFAYVVMP